MPDSIERRVRFAERYGKVPYLSSPDTMSMPAKHPAVLIVLIADSSSVAHSSIHGWRIGQWKSGMLKHEPYGNAWLGYGVRDQKIVYRPFRT